MSRRYFSLKWLLVYGYLAVVFALDPKLPDIIQWASDRWTYESVSMFVLGVEIAIAFSLVLFVGVLFFYNRRRVLPYVLIVGSGIITLYFFYRYFVPNPYELTHPPEYAVLSVLALIAFQDSERRSAADTLDPPGTGMKFYTNGYFKSLVLITLVSVIDELYHGLLPSRYFTYYDLFLNGLGAVMGLALMWALDRKAVNG